MRYAFLAVLAVFLFGAVGDEITIEKAPVTWQTKEYNPWYSNGCLQFEVECKVYERKNKVWNVFVHPDNISVEIDKDVKKLSLSASGKTNWDIYYQQIEADKAVLYVPNKEEKEKLDKYLQYLKDGLRRGFAGMSYEKIEEWNGGRVYVTVHDIFWNAGDPMMILVARDKISVVVDAKVGKGQRYVSATGAKVFYKGNSKNPTARLEAESVVISVWCQEECQKLKDQISKPG